MRPRRDGILASHGIVVALAAFVVAVARTAANADPSPSPPAPAPVPAVTGASDFTADIAAANELRRKGHAREAIALLSADYKKDPTNRDVVIAFAQTYSYSGDQGHAITLLDKLLSATPDDVDARIILAQAYAFNHDYAGAEAQYQKVLVAAPADSDAQVGLAQTYTFEGRYADAKKLFSTVLDKDPKNFDALVGLAGAESFGGDYKQARSDYQRVLNAQPDNSDALVGLASVEYWLNNLPAAIALDNRALALYPADSDARDLKKQLTIKTSPQIISTLTTSHSTDGSTFDYRLSERFFAAPSTSIGLVQELYRINDSQASVQTHKMGIVATYQGSSRFGVDLQLLASKYGGVGSVTDSVLTLFGANDGVAYGLGVSTGGVDGSVTANGGQTSPDQQSALVRITSLFGNLGYTRRATSFNLAAAGAAYNDGNRFHEISFDVSHQIGIGALMTVTPDIGVRSAAFSNTYNTVAQAIAPGYYNYSSQRDIAFTTTVNRQITERFSIGAIAALGARRTVVYVYPPVPFPPYVGQPVLSSPGSLPFQRLEPFFDYEGDRFSLAGALYDDHYRGGGAVGSYAASTVDVTFSIRLP
jgi:tetratricopeptide (TPR) repeat protein